jgi:hypothetical protein
MSTKNGEGLRCHSDLQKGLPGPLRLLNEPAADNSGTVNADPVFIADRLAIINHVLRARAHEARTGDHHGGVTLTG